MNRFSLSSRERVRLALEHQATDRVPIALVCSGINEPARAAFEEYIRLHHGLALDSYLEAIVDIKHVAPDYSGPRLKPGFDIWGVKRMAVSHGEGVYHEIERYPLAGVKTIDGIVGHTWPSPDRFDYSIVPQRIRASQADGDRCIMISNGNVFETGWYMRGLEQMFMDMLENPVLVHEILQRVTDFYVEYFRRILSVARGSVDLVFTADDIGGQNGLLLSLEMWEEFIKPHHQRLNAVIHEYGARVIYHSDGGIMEAIPGLIDMGIDVLQALQFDAAGMNAAEMKKSYGEALCFEGGVSVQRTLPFGTPDQVREEVQHLITTLGKNGGYILGPSHAIQAGTPPENILAMFETGLSFYPHG